MNKNRGFTLIELLVVISIIGILSSMILASLQSARSHARDAYRISSLRELQTALEIFYNSSGHYPFTNLDFNNDCARLGQNWIPDSGNYDWSTEAISSQPHDPIDNCVFPFLNDDTFDAATYTYLSDSTGQHYKIFARLENDSQYDISHAHTKGWAGEDIYDTYSFNPRTYALVR